MDISWKRNINNHVTNTPDTIFKCKLINLFQICCCFTWWLQLCLAIPFLVNAVQTTILLLSFDLSFLCFLYILLCLFWFCLLYYFFSYILFSLFLYVCVARYLYLSNIYLFHPINWIFFKLLWTLIRALLYLTLCEIAVGIP